LFQKDGLQRFNSFFHSGKALVDLLYHPGFLGLAVPARAREASSDDFDGHEDGAANDGKSQNDAAEKNRYDERARHDELNPPLETLQSKPHPVDQERAQMLERVPTLTLLLLSEWFSKLVILSRSPRQPLVPRIPLPVQAFFHS
jgi:hypothetical protein